jgi:hypothetical protein
MAWFLPPPEQRRCPADGADSDLFQPDNHEPCRILLICPRCGRWRIMTATFDARARAVWTDHAQLFDPAVPTPPAKPLETTPERSKPPAEASVTHSTAI